ncbi:MAG: carbohydrate kinase family protein, partial [Candidatus Kariarchaeaceae archaeon]
LNSNEQDYILPGKEYEAITYKLKAGGSVVNFVLQAKQLGAEVGLIGRIGNDTKGEELLELLTQEGIQTEFIIRSDIVKTCVNAGIMLKHSGQDIQIVAGDANKKLAIEDIISSKLNIDSLSVLYFGGYFKQESLYRDYPRLFRELQSKGIRIFMDHGRIPVDVPKDKIEILYEVLQFVEGYFPNEEELLGITSIESIDHAIQVALDFGPEFIAVKRGSNGCRLVKKEIDIQVPCYPVNVVTVIGAGDVFNAGFINQYIEGMDFQRCGEFANATAALYISKNEYATYQDVIDYMNITK